MVQTLPTAFTLTFADTAAHDVFDEVGLVFQRIIVNTSTNGAILWLSQGQNGAVSQGIPIAPGATYQENIDPVFTPDKHRWSIASSVAGGTAATFQRCV